VDEPAKGHVFLAHNSKDKIEIYALADWLGKREFKFWLDDHELRAGELWRGTAAEAVCSAAAMLVCIGLHGIGEEQRREYDIALKHRKKHPTYWICVVLLPTCPSEQDLPPEMSTDTFLDLRHAHHYQRLEAELHRHIFSDDSAAVGLAYRTPVLRSVTSGRRFEGPGGGRALPVSLFTGREQELLQLEQLFSRPASEVVAVVVHGNGGIGKTALAQQFVATHAQRLFPEGVLWLDGNHLPAEFERLVRHFGWRFDPDASLDALCRELSHALAERSVLVVVDDLPLDNARQSCVPLPGGRARTLITSRGQTLHSSLAAPARAVALSVWSPELSRTYLRKRVTSCSEESDADLDSLCDVVGHLPFAVTLLAQLLDNERGLHAATLRDELKQAPPVALDHLLEEAELRVMRGIAALFGKAYDGLLPSDRRVLQCLAQCARTEVEVVTAITQLALGDVKRGLNRLANQSLVEYSKDADRPWHLHELVRQFVRTQPGSEILEAAHRAWVIGYFKLHTDPCSFELRDRAVDEAAAALDRMLDKREGVAALQLFRLVYQHFRERGLHELAFQLGKRVLALQAPNSVQAAECMLCLAWSCRVRGDFRHAVEYCQRALQSYCEQGDVQGRAIALAHLGTCYRPLGELKNAVRCYNDALHLDELLGQRLAQADVLGNLGSCWSALGDLPKAIGYHARALSIYRARKELEPEHIAGEAIALGELGACYAQAGDMVNAFSSLREALRLNRQRGSLESELRNLGNLGALCNKQGDTPQAIEHHRQALALADNIGAVEEQIKTRVNLGLIFERQGDVAGALEHLHQADVLVKAAGITDGDPAIPVLRRALARLLT